MDSCWILNSSISTNVQTLSTNISNKLDTTTFHSNYSVNGTGNPTYRLFNFITSGNECNYAGSASTSNSTIDLHFNYRMKKGLTVNSYIFSAGNPGGYAKCAAAAFNVASSRRIKQNIIPLTEHEADKILEIETVSFDFINGDKNQTGVIAEDVLEIYPNVVSISDGYDENKPISKDNPPISVDYSKFVPYLIKKIQMMDNEIKSLKQRIGQIS